MAKKLKSIPVYLPDEKIEKLRVIGKTKRQPLTRVLEAEVDRLIKREYVEPVTRIS